MRVTAFTDYSLRVLVYLALRPARLTTAAELARVFDISKHHLMKVVQALARQGLVEPVRGRGGGLRLACAPELVRVGELVRRSEGEAIVECLPGPRSSCRIDPVCRLKGALAEALGAFYERLDAYTLADLVENRSPLLKALAGPEG